MLKTWIVALGFFALTTIAHAQYGQWTFGDSADNYSKRITIAQDGDLISCGETTVRRNNGATMAIEWTTRVPDFHPRDVIELAGGGIAAAGYHWGGDPSMPVVLMLVVYNGLGAVLWTHEYPGLGDNLELIQTHTGGFMIVCESYEADGTGSKLPFVIMTDPNGDELWMHRYHVAQFPGATGSFSHVIERVDATGAVLYHLTGKLTLEYVFDDYETLLVTLKENGYVDQAATIGMDGHGDYGRGLVFTGEAILVTGYSKDIGEGGGTYLMSVAPDLSLNWYQTIFGFTGTKEIIMAANRVAMLSGVVSHPDPNTDVAMIGISTVAPYPLTMGMRYGDTPFEDYGTSFASELSGYALLGTTKSFGVLGRDEYIIRTNAVGNSGCYEEPWAPDLELQLPDEAAPELVIEGFTPLRQTQHSGIALSPDLRIICGGDPPCVCVAPPPDMVGWWTFDELSGTVAADSAANNDGTLLNGATFVQGKVENGVFFDGVDDRIVIPHDLLLAVNGWAGDANGSFTIDAWLYVDTSGVADGGIVEKRALFGGAGYAFMVKDSMLKMWVSDGATTQTALSTLPLTAFGWTHVAVIVDRSSMPGDITFVVDGVAELFQGVVTNTGPMASSVPVWIGATRWMDTPGAGGKTIPGVLDEVEFFTRALDVSEIQTIYDADVCGKCKIDCNPPWDAPFCINESWIQVVIPVCNNSTAPMLVDLQFAGLTPPTCGGIDGPTTFTIISPGNPVQVPGNQCVNVTVKIDRPIQMTSLYDMGCYELTVTDTTSGASRTCRGSVQDRRDLCPLLPDDPVGMEVGEVAKVAVEVVVSEGLEPEPMTWIALAYGSDMTPSSLIGINGGEPGSIATGEFTPEPGSTFAIHLELLAEGFATGYSDIVLFTRSKSSKGETVPLGSFMVSIAPPDGGNEPCSADFNNDGKVDGGDLGLILSAWGTCDACQQDLNGDGTVDGGDLGLLLAAWGPC